MYGKQNLFWECLFIFHDKQTRSKLIFRTIMLNIRVHPIPSMLTVWQFYWFQPQGPQDTASSHIKQSKTLT